MLRAVDGRNSTEVPSALTWQLSDFKFALCVIYFVSMLLPAELNIDMWGVRLEPYRIILIICSFVFFPEIVRMAREKTTRFLFAYVVMGSVALFVNHLFGSLEAILINVLGVLVGFAVGLSISGRMDRLVKLIKFVSISYLLLIPFALLEIQDGYRLLHVWAADISGSQWSGIKGSVEFLGESYYRYGMHRASTVFSHPILYSVVAAMTITIVCAVFPKSWLIWSLGFFVALVTSVTSAGMMMFIMFVGMRFLRKISNYYKSIFKHLAIIGIGWFMLLSVFSNRGPIPAMIDMMALNPSTGYARYLQWEFVADDIKSNPLFGIGFNEWSRPWWMSASIDNFWLMTAVKFGCVSLVLLIIFFGLLLNGFWKLYRSTNSSFYFLVFVVILQLVFAGMTVHFFDRASLYIFLILGAMTSFLHNALPMKTEASKTSRDEPGESRIA